MGLVVQLHLHSGLWVTGTNVEEVHFGSKSTNSECANKRAEMYFNLREWLKGDVKLPDDDEVEADLTCFGFKHDIHGKLGLEPKDAIKKRLKRSPDVADAIALCFVYELGPDVVNSVDWNKFRNRDAIYSW